MDIEMENTLFETNKPFMKKSHGFGIFTFRRLMKLLRVIFSYKICLTFLSLICLMALLEQFLIYHVGLIPSGFFKVLGDKKWGAFWVQVLKSTMLILAICFVLSCKTYITNVYYVTSREILTKKLHSLYFNNNKFYYINSFKYSSADNPDQRITQDIDKFCNQFSSVINPFIIAPFTIPYYSYNCYETNGWVGPVSIFALFLLSATINKLLMKPIVSKVIEQEKCEGFFRFKHMHVRTNAESIALQNASFAEMSKAESKLFNLIKVQQSLYLRNLPLDIAVNIFNYAGSIVSYLIVAYPIFSWKYNNLTASDLSQLISKNAFVSIYLISCFSSLIKVSSAVSKIGGLTHRVCEILDVLNETNSLKNEDICNENHKLKPGLISGDSGISVFELLDVTICPPKGTKPLVSNLYLDITFGKNLLITGKSGSGKSSIFRVIKGLWPMASGQVIRQLPFLSSLVFFLPQHSLLSDGTLLEQIVYPLEVPKFLKLQDEDIEIILSFLKFVDMDHILQKVGLNSEVEWNWYDVLSPGEYQRLSFVRLFFHKPKFAFVDEATSALGPDMEENIYEKCKELGITMISIGHRDSLLKYHDNVLKLDGEGGWKLSPIQL